MSDPVDLPELRRLAEAASEPGSFAGTWDRYREASPPDVVLALLDRIDALDEAYETVVATNRQALRERDEARAQRDGLDAGYAEAGRLLRRIISQHWGSDFTNPEVGGSFAVCADMDAVELAAWLAAELNEPGSADPGAVAGEPESEGTT